MFMRLALATMAALALAAPKPAAAEAVVLRVGSGSSGSGMHALTMSDLEAMPQVVFTTSTVWTDRAVEFSGPSVATVLRAIGVTGETVRATALNDYAVDIPVSALEDDAPIIATRIDGAHFPRREKGPLWIVYPYDSAERYQTETTYGRSIWQLRDLEVR